LAECGHEIVVNTIVSPGPKKRLVAGIRPSASTTTRAGWRGAATSRTVSDGSSDSTVPAPTKTASHSSRRACTRRREPAPVIHRDDPSGAAILPSSDSASFRVTNGRPVVR
jgi:hypothetical protein